MPRSPIASLQESTDEGELNSWQDSCQLTLTGPRLGLYNRMPNSSGLRLPALCCIFTSMLVDTYKRPIKDLRISVTDRCNFRCSYCMPLDEYEWINKKEILTFEEITRLATLFVSLGVEKIRLTGGEPLVRQHLDRLV